MAGTDGLAPLRALLESLLCASGEPLTPEKAAEVIGNVTRAEVKRTAIALQAEYERDKRGFRIVEVAGGYQLRTAPQNREYVRRLLRERPMRLTRPMLETLAIVAYKQPVTRPEIEAIRGVDVDSVLATLLDRSLIRIAGRKEAPGRPLLYATSREFLEVFSLRHLSDLPTLKELDELEILSASQIEFAAGAATGAGAEAGTRGDAVTEMPLVPGRTEPEVGLEGELSSQERGPDGSGGADVPPPPDTADPNT
jgi:segregation and condensation protein B